MSTVKYTDSYVFDESEKKRMIIFGVLPIASIDELVAFDTRSEASPMIRGIMRENGNQFYMFSDRRDALTRELELWYGKLIEWLDTGKNLNSDVYEWLEDRADHYSVYMPSLAIFQFLVYKYGVSNLPCSSRPKEALTSPTRMARLYPDYSSVIHVDDLEYIEHQQLSVPVVLGPSDSTSNHVECTINISEEEKRDQLSRISFMSFLAMYPRDDFPKTLCMAVSSESSNIVRMALSVGISLVLVASDCIDITGDVTYMTFGEAFYQKRILEHNIDGFYMDDYPNDEEQKRSFMACFNAIASIKRVRYSILRYVPPGVPFTKMLGSLVRRFDGIEDDSWCREFGEFYTPDSLGNVLYGHTGWINRYYIPHGRGLNILKCEKNCVNCLEEDSWIKTLSSTFNIPMRRLTIHANYRPPGEDAKKAMLAKKEFMRQQGVFDESDRDYDDYDMACFSHYGMLSDFKGVKISDFCLYPNKDYKWVSKYHSQRVGLFYGCNREYLEDVHRYQEDVLCKGLLEGYEIDWGGPNEGVWRDYSTFDAPPLWKLFGDIKIQKVDGMSKLYDYSVILNHRVKYYRSTGDSCSRFLPDALLLERGALKRYYMGLLNDIVDYSSVCGLKNKLVCDHCTGFGNSQKQLIIYLTIVSPPEFICSSCGDLLCCDYGS